MISCQFVERCCGQSLTGNWVLTYKSIELFSSEVSLQFQLSEGFDGNFRAGQSTDKLYWETVKTNRLLAARSIRQLTSGRTIQKVEWANIHFSFCSCYFLLKCSLHVLFDFSMCPTSPNQQPKPATWQAPTELTVFLYLALRQHLNAINIWARHKIDRNDTLVQI
jgi:hypothetical protein